MPSKKTNTRSTKRGSARTTKKAPRAVKVIAILAYIAAALWILGGVIFIGASSFISSGLNDLAAMDHQPMLPEITPTIVLLFGCILLLGGLLGILIGRNLWRGKQWARIIVIIITLCGTLNAFLAIAHGNYLAIPKLLLDGFIAGYLLLDNDVKKFFKQ